MRVFVTVGSTKFDALVSAVLSPDVTTALRQRGCITLVMQCGNSALDDSILASSAAGADQWAIDRDGLRIEIWRFRSSLEDEYPKAEWVISHAGSGTILDVLRLTDGSGRVGRPMIIVPNPTLLDNHQGELAKELGKMGYLVPSTTQGLAETIRTFDPTKIVPFPAFDGSRFTNLMDEVAGFI